MPIYEYECQKCKARKEKLQKLSDAPLTKCDECGEDALVKMLSANTGFCLMGYGWDKPGMRAGSSRKI